jgi:hypothetical protein
LRYEKAPNMVVVATMIVRLLFDERDGKFSDVV